MCKEIKNLKDYAKSNSISIEGLEKLPELGITPIQYMDPFDGEYYESEDNFLTMAKHPSGKLDELNKVSKQYKLVQHYEALHQSLESIINGAPEFGKPDVNLSFDPTGGRMWAKMLFPEVINIMGDKDPVKPQCIITNSADLSKRFTIIFGAFRLICSNGLVIPDSRFPDHVLIKNLHKKGTLDLDSAISKMMVGFESFSETIGLWKEYAELEIGKEWFSKTCLDSGFSEKQLENIAGSSLRGFDTPLGNDFVGKKKANGWKAYNAATQFITDNNVNEGTALLRGRNISDRFDSLLKAA